MTKLPNKRQMREIQRMYETFLDDSAGPQAQFNLAIHRAWWWTRIGIAFRIVFMPWWVRLTAPIRRVMKRDPRHAV
jgi:hypothetical protein